MTSNMPDSFFNRTKIVGIWDFCWTLFGLPQIGLNSKLLEWDLILFLKPNSLEVQKKTSKNRQTAIDMDVTTSTLIKSLLLELISPKLQSSPKDLTDKVKDEISKYTHDVTLEPFTTHDYLTKYKYHMISVFFFILVLISLASPATTSIISVLFVFFHYLVYHARFFDITKYLPGKSANNIFAYLPTENVESAKTVLVIAHTDKTKKDVSRRGPVIQVIMNVAIYLLTLCALIGFVGGFFFGDYLLYPVISISSVLCVILSLSIIKYSALGDIQGIATTSCAIEILNKFSGKYGGNSCDNSDKKEKQKVNLAILIVPTNSERHEGVKAFMTTHDKDKRVNPESTTVICLDQLDDSGNIRVLKREGFSVYNTEVMQRLVEASQEEGIKLFETINILRTPFTNASECNKIYKVAAIQSLCRTSTRVERDGIEYLASLDGIEMMIHEDQIKTINDVSEVIMKYITLEETPIGDKENTSKKSESFEEENTHFAEDKGLLNSVVIDD
ncbi:hypothetical protein EIN_086420 [Entamoeba invadens IP1]|uniref:hypothetical protein n=1 Tax=Entamoeba invadens IP1 TaxID=370355 RepID=UPI0002C3E018|nr:hypothetical protein EIN_086420 [Entamoeba invadens IP1]ELP85370.1 hypothetical protein EIN_086420 [Entamoeba invadens IP1]|eukprot:XP_004184716.1 hypothetical protein EIN_086420 [Entamoeba invadens IP1]